MSGNETEAKGAARREGWGLAALGVVAVGVGFILAIVSNDLRLGLTGLACIALIGPGLVIYGLIVVTRNRKSHPPR